MAVLLNFIQIYFSREIKLNFFHLSIGKSFYTGKNYLTRKPEISTCIWSQYLWYNNNIQVEKNSTYLVRFSEKNINYVSQLFGPEGSTKTWLELKTEHELNTYYFQWLQLVSAIPEGRTIIKETHESTTNLIIHDHHVIKGSRILTLDKLSSTELYTILISKVQNKPSSNSYFKNLFDDNDID